MDFVLEQQEQLRVALLINEAYKNVAHVRVIREYLSGQYCPDLDGRIASELEANNALGELLRSPLCTGVDWINAIVNEFQMFKDIKFEGVVSDGVYSIIRAGYPQPLLSGELLHGKED